ncbi:MAG: hypothetical protein ACPL1K_05235, partial [Candidatus Kryptoniota bacterium]
QGFNGLMWLVIALLRKSHDWITYVTGVYGLIFFLAAVASPLFDRRRQLVVDENGISGQLSWRRRIEFKWKDIVGAELGMLHLKLQTADGKVEVINLGNLTYQEHQELKPQLRTALESHGLLKESDQLKRSE